MLIRFLRFVRGYVYIMFSGENPERMLTILSRSRLPFWNIKRRKGGISVCMLAAHFKKLRPLRRGAETKVHITARRGLPFLASRYSQRWGFAIGFCLFLLLNWVASLFIWNISIEGNSKIPSREILAYLGELGIKEGTLSRNIDCDNVRVLLAKDIPDVSWASLSIEGCRLTVSLHERHAIDKTDTRPQNLIASRNGIIESIRILKGKTLIKKGDIVEKGQLLVSGAMEYSTGAAELIASRGEIFAITSREISVEQPLSYIQTRRTGKTAKRNVLSFFGLNIPLYLGEIKGDYEKTTETSRIETPKGYLPITITTATFYFTEQRMINLSETEAMAEAKAKMEELCQKNGEYEIVSFEDSFAIEGDICRLTRHIQARENIALPEILEIDSANSQ